MLKANFTKIMRYIGLVIGVIYGFPLMIVIAALFDRAWVWFFPLAALSVLVYLLTIKRKDLNDEEKRRVKILSGVALIPYEVLGLFLFVLGILILKEDLKIALIVLGLSAVLLSIITRMIYKLVFREFSR